MPKVRGLTQKERDAQVIEQEIQRASQDFLNVAREKRGREDKTYAQVAEDIGVSKDTFWQWRDGKLPSAGFGRVVAAYARMGYRLVPEPIAGSRKGALG